jgi:hypothetical protein
LDPEAKLHARAGGVYDVTGKVAEGPPPGRSTFDARVGTSEDSVLVRL